MDVLIRLEHTEPPAGMVVPPEDRDGSVPALPFVGWLGLLRALAEVVRTSTDPVAGG